MKNQSLKEILAIEKLQKDIVSFALTKKCSVKIQTQIMDDPTNNLYIKLFVFKYVCVWFCPKQLHHYIHIFFSVSLRECDYSIEVCNTFSGERKEGIEKQIINGVNSSHSHQSALSFII